MSFTQEQKSLHQKAIQALSSIELIRESVTGAVSENDRERLYGRLGEKQLEYADIMKQLTEKYIPMGLQLSNAVSIGSLELTNDER